MPAGGDEVAFLSLLGLEASEVCGGLRAAERTAESREDPAAAAHVAREPTLARLDEVAEAGRRAAVRTDAELPASLREMDPASGEVPIERRTQRAAGEEAHGLGAEAKVCRQRLEPDTAPGRKECGGADLGPIPRGSEFLESLLGLTDCRQEIEG